MTLVDRKTDRPSGNWTERLNDRLWLTDRLTTWVTDRLTNRQRQKDRQTDNLGHKQHQYSPDIDNRIYTLSTYPTASSFSERLESAMEKTCSLIGQPSNKCSSAYLHATICPFSSPSSHKKMDARNENEHGNYVVVHVEIQIMPGPIPAIMRHILR